LEADQPFGEATRSTAHHAFVARRLAFGAAMLRDLWWSAWVESGAPPTRDADPGDALPAARPGGG
ncbi:MAG TPA: hypothetical protein VMM12_12730, partial [Longimicrobiales bacterium]|nr:hypothetical protein [Longimicrobiales bacterium]